MILCEAVKRFTPYAVSTHPAFYFPRTAMHRPRALAGCRRDLRDLACHRGLAQPGSSSLGARVTGGSRFGDAALQLAHLGGSRGSLLLV